MVDAVIILYSSDQSSFGNTSGYGHITEAISCEVEEERNGTFELKMKYPSNGILRSHLVNRNIIYCKPSPSRNAQAFRIYNVSKETKGYITISASHISYDLSGCARWQSKEITYVNEKDEETGEYDQTKTACIKAFNSIIASYDPDDPTEKIGGAIWRSGSVFNLFSFVYHRTDAPVEMTYTYGAGFSNLREVLGGSNNSILSVFGGELLFDNRTIHYYDKRAISKGSIKYYQLRYRKNIQDITSEYSSDLCYSALLPYLEKSTSSGSTWEMLSDTYYPLDGYTLSTIDYSRILPVNINELPFLPSGVTFKTWTQAGGDTGVKAMMKRYVEENNIGIVNTTIDVTYADLMGFGSRFEAVPNADRIDLCDMVNVYYPGVVDTVVQKEVIKITYDVLRNKITELTLGDRSTTSETTLDGMITTISSNYNDVQTILSQHDGDYLPLSAGSSYPLTGDLYMHITSDTDAESLNDYLTNHIPEDSNVESLYVFNPDGLPYSKPLADFAMDSSLNLYLPLSAGTNKALTGTLYSSVAGGTEWTDGFVWNAYNSDDNGSTFKSQAYNDGDTCYYYRIGFLYHEDNTFREFAKYCYDIGGPSSELTLGDVNFDKVYINGQYITIRDTLSGNNASGKIMLSSSCIMLGSYVTSGNKNILGPYNNNTNVYIGYDKDEIYDSRFGSTNRYIKKIYAEDIKMSGSLSILKNAGSSWTDGFVWNAYGGYYLLRLQAEELDDMFPSYRVAIDYESGESSASIFDVTMPQEGESADSGWNITIGDSGCTNICLRSDVTEIYAANSSNVYFRPYDGTHTYYFGDNNHRWTNIYATSINFKTGTNEYSDLLTYIGTYAKANNVVNSIGDHKGAVTFADGGHLAINNANQMYVTGVMTDPGTPASSGDYFLSKSINTEQGSETTVWKSQEELFTLFLPTSAGSDSPLTGALYFLIEETSGSLYKSILHVDNFGDEEEPIFDISGYGFGDNNLGVKLSSNYKRLLEYVSDDSGASPILYISNSNIDTNIYGDHIVFQANEIYSNCGLSGKLYGTNPRTVYNGSAYFSNVNASTTSQYIFCLGQYKTNSMDAFQLKLCKSGTVSGETYGTFVKNLVNVKIHNAGASNVGAVVDFVEQPTYNGASIATEDHVDTTVETAMDNAVKYTYSSLQYIFRTQSGQGTALGVRSNSTYTDIQYKAGTNVLGYIGMSADGKARTKVGIDGTYKDLATETWCNNTFEPKSSCLIEGTLITMYDGTTKPIEEIKIGDSLMSWNPVTKTATESIVIGTKMTGNEQEYTSMMFDDGTHLETYGKHSFWRHGNGIVDVKDWNIGDKANALSGEFPELVWKKTVHFPIKKRHYVIYVSNNLYYANGILTGHWSSTKVNYLNTLSDPTFPAEVLAKYTEEANANNKDQQRYVTPDFISKTKGILKEISSMRKTITNYQGKLDESDYKPIKAAEKFIQTLKGKKLITLSVIKEALDAITEYDDSDRETWRTTINDLKPTLATKESELAALRYEYNGGRVDVGALFRASVNNAEETKELVRAWAKSKE